jgi:hypothetical protein
MNFISELCKNISYKNKHHSPCSNFSLLEEKLSDNTKDDMVPSDTSSNASLMKSEIYKVYNVLFLNHKKQQCGVYQYGIRLFNILKTTDKSYHFYQEVDSLTEYQRIFEDHKNIDIVIYNFHEVTMPWLNKNTINKSVVNLGIMHETQADYFDVRINIDPTFKDCENHFSIGRPIFHNAAEILKDYQPSTDSIHSFIHYKKANVPTFGSFGFGQSHKKFENIVKLVNEQYNEAIIKIVMPLADFIPDRDYTNHMVRDACLRNMKKPDIQLMITHEFFTNEDVLCFLNSNDMNMFLYESNGYPSSVTDYAVSLKKPFGISNYPIFKHIYSDDICLSEVGIKDCMANSRQHCDKYLELYSKENMINKFLYIYQKMLPLTSV